MKHLHVSTDCTTGETEATILLTEFDLVKSSLVVKSIWRLLETFGAFGNSARTTSFRVFFCFILGFDTSSSVLAFEELEENKIFFRSLLDFLSFSSSSTSVINSASFAFIKAASYVANDK